MENVTDQAKTYEFRLNPTGGETTLTLKFSGIAAGNYRIELGGAAGQATEILEGNIEKAVPHKFEAGAGLRRIAVKIHSVSFMASDPGGYRVIVAQAGGNTLETPELDHHSEVEITVNSGAA